MIKQRYDCVLLLGLGKYLPILTLEFKKDTSMQPRQRAVSAILKVYKMVNIKPNLRVTNQENHDYRSDE